MMSAATYTSPIPLAEFQPAIDLSAHGAGLGRRCPTVNLHDMEVMPDHVHLFVVANPNMNIETIVKYLKGLFLVPPQAHLHLFTEISQPVDSLILRGIRRAYIGKGRGEVYRFSKIKDAFISRLKPGRIPTYYLKIKF